MTEINFDKIGGVQLHLKTDTSIGLVLRSLYEHSLYMMNKNKSIKKVSTNIYYTTKDDLKIKDKHKISAKYLEIDALLEELIKQVKENKTLESDTVINTTIYINFYDGENGRFLLYNKSQNEILVELIDKSKINKHIDIKPIKDKPNCKAYIFSKECDLKFIKKPSQTVFEEIEAKLTGYDLITINQLKKILEDKKNEENKHVEEPEHDDDLPFEKDEVAEIDDTLEVEEVEEVDIDDLFEPTSKSKTTTKQDDDDDPLSGDLDEDDIIRN